MKRNILVLPIFLILSLACSLGSLGGSNDTAANTPAPALVSENRCGDKVCDGPENVNNCPADCSGNAKVDENQDQPDQQEPAGVKPSEIATGVVHAEIKLDRTPGVGNCGIEPWASSDCTMDTKVWWEIHLKALASTPVLIIPDGQDRWVITSQKDVAQKYNINLDDYDYTPYVGKYSEAAINLAATNPECSATIQGPDFDFQVMGTRQEGLLELILSSNPTELIQGACGQAKFNWETEYLLYGWATALTRDPMNLSFQMNDTFYKAPGTYTYEVTMDTNPSPENRDHVFNRLEFLCMGEETANVRAPVACPWEK